MKKTSALGMGLDALFEKNDILDSDISYDPKEKSVVKLLDVEPNKEQPRKNFNKESLEELAASIKEHGLLQPILVTEIKGSKGKYRIISGERRWRASRIAGLSEIPVIVKDLSKQQIMEISLIENLQREDLNAVEEARGYDVLIKEFGLTQDAVAKRVGKSRPVIANALRILSLPDYVISSLEKEEISAGQARSLIPIKEKMPEDEFKKFVDIVKAKNLTVREIEAFAKKLSTKPKIIIKEDPADIYIREIEKDISARWGRKIKISGVGKKGKIEIEYYDADDFNDLIETLKNKE
ncbi:MAG: ParB/RepB/Spo0J family partition protein [Clostridiales bacterium]|nr:ParB/RepB/Spo0J family partition protein [Clostridiales bacterium]